MKAILAFGNPADGFEYVGPFETAEDAITYAEAVDDSRDWWSIALNDPDPALTEDPDRVR